MIKSLFSVVVTDRKDDGGPDQVPLKVKKTMLVD